MKTFIEALVVDQNLKEVEGSRKENSVITSAALRSRVTQRIYAASTHFEALNRAHRNGEHGGIGSFDQGFVDQFGKFFNRYEALRKVEPKLQRIVKRDGRNYLDAGDIYFYNAE
jgi:hypothetical protein